VLQFLDFLNRNRAANAFLVYLEPGERACWLQMSLSSAAAANSGTYGICPHSQVHNDRTVPINNSAIRPLNKNYIAYFSLHNVPLPLLSIRSLYVFLMLLYSAPEALFTVITSL